MKCEVYLNKRAMGKSSKRIYSVRKNKRVIGSSKWVLLSNVKLVVHNSGRQDTLRRLNSKGGPSKTVHAFLRGDIVARGTHAIKKAKELGLHMSQLDASYNPLLNDSFVDKHTGKKIQNAKYAFCEREHIYCA